MPTAESLHGQRISILWPCEDGKTHHFEGVVRYHPEWHERKRKFEILFEDGDSRKSCLKDKEFTVLHHKIPRPEQKSAKTPRSATDAETRIWNPAVSVSLPIDKYKLANLLEAPEPALELQRLKKTKALRSKLHKLCQQHKVAVPILAFERWQCRCKLQEHRMAGQRQGSRQSNGAKGYGKGSAPGGATVVHGEPLLPASSWVDDAFVKDLVRGRVPPSAAAEIVQQMTDKSLEMARELCAGTSASDTPEEGVEEQVCTSSRKLPGRDIGEAAQETVDYSLSGQKPFLRINREHQDKLEVLWCRHSKHPHAPAQPPGSDRGLDHDHGQDHQTLRMTRHIWCLLARYEALHGLGFQAALSEHSFDVLKDCLGVEMECFASPLNCRYTRYCSAFPDTDSYFGSVGSFFDFFPPQGSFEANPPFVPEVMSAMVKHCEALLQSATGPMSFTIVLPHWPEVLASKLLARSRWRRAQLVVDGEGHGYCDGAQHQRRAGDRFRASSFATIVTFLQNDSGAQKWTVTADVKTKLQVALGKALPDKAAANRRMEHEKSDAVALLLRRRQQDS